MNAPPQLGQMLVLLAGDLFVFALVTLFGFARHGELATSGARLLTTFIPLTIAWLLVAPFLGAFDKRRVADPRQLWRPFWAMILAGPMAAWLRGMLLNEPIQPVFVAVLGGISALALLGWRSLYWFAILRKKPADG
jgi:hypothetical protein